MTLIIAAKKSLIQGSEDIPSLTVLPKPLVWSLDARMLNNVGNGAPISEITANGTWPLALRQMKNVLGVEKTGPYFFQTGGADGGPRLYFDGNSNIRSNNALTNAEPLAFAMLVKTNSFNSNGRGLYVGSTAESKRGIQVGTTGYSAMYGNSLLPSGNTNNGYSVVIAYFNLANSRICVDGVITTGQTTGTADFSSVTIGGDNTGTTSFKGDVCYAAIYSGVLTDSEILDWGKEIRAMF